MDRLFAQGVAQRDEFAHRHRAALGAAHRQLQQCIEVAVRCRGQLQHHRIGVLAAIVQIDRRVAGEAGTQRIDDRLLRYPQHRRLAPVDRDQRARCVGDARVVDSDDAFGALEHGPHRLGHGAPAVGLRTVDLGHQR